MGSVTYSAKTSNKAKEIFGTSIIKAILLSRGYHVAMPEPDIGDDLWIYHPRDNEFLRCQIKNIFSTRVAGQHAWGVANVRSVKPQKEQASRNLHYLFAMFEKDPSGRVTKRVHLGLFTARQCHSLLRRYGQEGQRHQRHKAAFIVTFHIFDAGTKGAKYRVGPNVRKRRTVTARFRHFGPPARVELRIP